MSALPDEIRPNLAMIRKIIEQNHGRIEQKYT